MSSLKSGIITRKHNSGGLK